MSKRKPACSGLFFGNDAQRRTWQNALPVKVFLARARFRISSVRKIQNFRSHEKQKPKHKILDANRTPKSLLQVNNAGHKSDVVMLATLSKND